MRLPNKEEFNFKECVIAGDPCWLITPNSIKVKWNQSNESFRSCIIRQLDHKCISRGFSKFSNFLENPEFQPWDSSWPVRGYYKYDGSSLIISKYKGELIVRTRGTTDARFLQNGFEIDWLINKYPLLFNNSLLNAKCCSFVCEWTTPNNIICLRESEEPALFLLAIIDNVSAEHLPQGSVDIFGQEWCVARPQFYKYDSIAECCLDVENWKKKEGIVLYSPDSQTLKKIKSNEYLAMHRLFSGYNSLGNIIDLFLASPRFKKYEEFYDFVATTMDYELAEKIKEEMQIIVAAYNEFSSLILDIQIKIKESIAFLETRRCQALKIQEIFKGWKTSVAFSLLDNREITDTMLKKILEQITNK